MPEYSYACRKCEHAYEEFRAISEGHPKKCPTCGEPYGDKHQFNLNFSEMRITGIVYGNPTTIGQLAEQNSKKMGKELVQRTQERDQERLKNWTGSMPEGGGKVMDHRDGEDPWWRNGTIPGVPVLNEPLAIKEVQDPNKYITTGQK